MGAAADPIKLRVGNAGPGVFPVSGGHPVVGAAVYDERGAGDGGQVELGNGPNLDRVVLQSLPAFRQAFAHGGNEEL